jgi:hypothetical protein
VAELAPGPVKKLQRAWRMVVAILEIAEGPSNSVRTERKICHLPKP